MERYSDVIMQQREEGIVEPVSSPLVGEKFCIPPKAVVREAAESTKLPFVYDASARESREVTFPQ